MGGKCVTWKNNRWISLTSFNGFSSSFHQKLSHCILPYNSWNKLLSKCIKNSRHQKSSWCYQIRIPLELFEIIDYIQCMKVINNFEFGNIRTNDHCLSLFPKIVLHFQPFLGIVANKKGYRSLRWLNISKNVWHIMIGVPGFYKKCAIWQRFAAELSLPFGFMEKS